MKRDSFGSKLGIIAAAAGSAIGLGNIWKFPYIVGENGGAAFILVYLVFIALIGIPLMTSEFVIGRRAKKNAIGSFKELAPNTPWWLAGVTGVLAAFIILSFYLVVAGWVFAYVAKAITGKLITIAPENLGSYFDGLTTSVGEPIFWSFVVMALTAFIVVAGIQKGIEKYSKILMPVLLVLLVVLMGRSLTLEGASKGLEFLFKPDFSQLKMKGVLEALGHAFFSLSLGMGTMITYGSYIGKKQNLSQIALQVSIADTLIALMAGVVIFPAVFAFGFEPEVGPALIFITLPAVFQVMPFGAIFETLFFILIGIATITSTISILEVIVAYFTEEFNIGRKKATIVLSTILFMFSIPNSLSMGKWSGFTIFGKTIFGVSDFVSSNILLPLGGLCVALFIGWAMKPKDIKDELTNEGTIEVKSFNWYLIANKIVAPVGITLVLLSGLGLLDKIMELIG